MIRLIQRRLIIPRGDTGTFTVPLIASATASDIAVFTIFDCLTHTKLFQKKITTSEDTLTIEFTHGDTVNLKPGHYVWDIKFYKNPVFADEELISGEEIDSYYAGFTLPVCEIRETGDNLSLSDDAPTSTISPMSLNIVNAAISEANITKREAIASAAAAAISETNAAASESAAANSALNAANVANTAVSASETATSANTNAQTAATTATTKASEAAQSAADALAAVAQITNLSVQTTTLNPTATATSSYNPTTGILSLGIPQGHTISSIVKTATNGLIDTYTITLTNGNTSTFTITNGTTPSFSIGNVTEGANAAATITGTNTNPILNLVLPNANVPTKVSQLQNDSNYAVDANYVHTDNNYTTAEKEKLSGIAAGAEVNVNADWNAVSGDAQILNKPTKVSAFTNDAGYLTQHQDISGKANSADLAAVATSGSYNDLLNKPSIPSRVSDLTDDSGHYTKPAGGIPATDLAETYLTQHQDISGKLDVSLKGAVNGLAELGADGKVPSSQLPSYVDDVIEYDNINAFPATGETGKIYVAKNTNLTYRWGGSDYVVISPSLALGDTSSTAFRGDYGAAAYAHAVTNKGAAFNNGLYKITTNAEGHVTAATAVEKSDITGLGIPAQDTTYESKIAAENGTNVSLVTTGEKYNWNNKYDKPSSGIPAADIAGGVIPDSIMDLTNNSNFVSASFDDNNLILQTGGQGINIALPVQDVQVNGKSVLSNGVANVPVADGNNFGVVKVANQGVGLNSNNVLQIISASLNTIKSGVGNYNPVSPAHQHESAFYGLSKAAGDATQSASSNAVGVYTETAKSKISDMLNSPVSVSGSTPSITAMAGVQYVCGEVATLDITLPASGCVDVVFESGSTPTVLTVTPPNGVTVKWANGFDPSSLDANTTYEINIMNGLGVAVSWT